MLLSNILYLPSILGVGDYILGQYEMKSTLLCRTMLKNNEYF